MLRGAPKSVPRTSLFADPFCGWKLNILVGESAFDIIFKEVGK
jgi:hypothetical protein